MHCQAIAHQQSCTASPSPHKSNLHHGSTHFGYLLTVYLDLNASKSDVISFTLEVSSSSSVLTPSRLFVILVLSCPPQASSDSPASSASPAEHDQASSFRSVVHENIMNSTDRSATVSACEYTSFLFVCLRFVYPRICPRNKLLRRRRLFLWVGQPIDLSNMLAARTHPR